jgi:rhamnogalacturonan acetylesterase
MLYSQVVSVLALATTAFAAPSGDVQKRAQTVYLAGDSTMARASGAITGMLCLVAIPNYDLV